LKQTFTLLFVALLSLNTFAQKIDYSLDSGYIAEGHDVTEYFNGKAVKGKSKKFVPQYGGYCAYAMSRKKKVEPNPEVFKIQDGQLLLFYTSWTKNTKEEWEEEGPKKLKLKADANWEKVKYKK